MTGAAATLWVSRPWARASGVSDRPSATAVNAANRTFNPFSTDARLDIRVAGLLDQEGRLERRGGRLLIADGAAAHHGEPWR